MSDFNFATWRLGLHRQLANAAVIEPPLLEQLDGAWGQAHSAFETTGAISLQFISYIERKFPYEFNLLVSPHLNLVLSHFCHMQLVVTTLNRSQAHAATGVERHRLKEQCLRDPLPSDASLLPVLANRMHARILMAMTGTSSQREREDGIARNPTFVRNNFLGSMMREVCILHSLDPKLLISLQTHLGIAVKAAVNVSEISQYLLAFQVVPNEELSRKYLLGVQQRAQENRIARLVEWAAQGDGCEAGGCSARHQRLGNQRPVALGPALDRAAKADPRRLCRP